MKGILLCDTPGRKYDGVVKSTVKRYIPGATPHSQTNVLCGELLVDYYQEGQPFNYQVYNDPSVVLNCEVGIVSPLGEEEFLLLEAISRPADRIEAFRHKLEFGVNLQEGASVTVTLKGANLSAPPKARAVVHYKGRVGNQTGTLFGVEVLGTQQREAKVGVSDGTFQHHRYFTCEDGCGLFVSLRCLSPADGESGGTSDRADKQRGGESNPSYSQVAGGGPAQNTRSGGRALYSKSASTDCSPSATHRSQGTPSYGKSTSRDDAKSSSKPAPSKGKGSESSVDPTPYRFKKGQRVMFYNDKGEKHYGIVGWTGKNTRTRTFDYTLVGIQTDKPVYKSDYEHSRPGMDHLLSAPKKRALFLPEALVEEISKAGESESSPRPARSDTAQEIAGVLNMNEDSLIKQQVVLLEKAEKDKTAKEDEASLKALEASEESIDITKQAERYKKLAQGHVQDDQCQLANVYVPRQQEEMRRYEAEKRAQGRNNAGDGLGAHAGDSKYPNTGWPRSSHDYDDADKYFDPSLRQGPGGAGAPPPYDAKFSPSSQHRQILQKQHDTRPAQDQWEPHDQATAGGQPPYQGEHRQPGPDKYQGASYTQEPSTHGYASQSSRAEQGQGYQQDRLPPHTHQDIPMDQNQIPRAGQDPQGPRTEQYNPGENRDLGQAAVSQFAQGHPLGPPANGYSAGAQEQGVVPPAGIAASTGPPAEENLSHGLGVGSLIQLPAMDGSVKYGTIKWTGLIPAVQGEIAGIELEEPMEGCSDGMFQNTGQKFFNCPHGMGLYYPLNKLRPDQRWAPQVAADGNPLRHVRSEELLDTPAPDTLEMYIGNERGIQGHQNSCYLDATLFGLFAICTEFDTMFLNKESDIGRTLWRNIVNPLRKNGVVKYECVMRLREQLDKLGQMKGITQDEKDPEEFLNLMFKHTLHVPPFISIRRPFGVEKEYFVQLFSEMDGSKEPPSIGNLLEKMFLEQHISFTEVPSKLLIQVPRFGKKFQTFQKIIPAKIINVASIVDVKGKCFFCGEDNARHYCPDCEQEFSDPTYCDRCLGLAHQKRTDHKQVGLTKEAFHLKTLADLELLSVICIETSHYVCFTRQEDRWIFFDSMANRVYDKYNIPKVDECTRDLNNWVYPPDGDISRLLNTPPRELPEYVRRFTQDIYMCVYIQPDMSMYA